MSIYKITHSAENRRAHLYNWGCSFRCKGCAYKLRAEERPDRFLDVGEIRSVLLTLQDLERVHFLGGEPSINEDLPQLLDMCKNELELITWLGHTNGSRLPLANLDGANVSLKAFSAELYQEYTGYPRQPIYDNFEAAYQAGISLRAETVLIPDYIDVDEVEAIAQFVASVDQDIAFHVTGYMRVPRQPWREPTVLEMQRAVAAAKKYLGNVSFSHLTGEEYTRLRNSSTLYRSVRVA